MAKFKSAKSGKKTSEKVKSARAAIPCLFLVTLGVALTLSALLFRPAIQHTMRIDHRKPDQMRPVRITTNYLMTAEGSVLIEVGHTRVLCAATVEDTVPPFLRGSGRGWVTAEYSMLPRATATRTPREVTKGRQSGRTLEIQRLIGRSLRSVVDMAALGDRTVMVDCDVLQADGGTRTASITGAYVAMVQALRKLVKFGALKSLPVTQPVAATSVGISARACPSWISVTRKIPPRKWI